MKFCKNGNRKYFCNTNDYEDYCERESMKWSKKKSLFLCSFVYEFLAQPQHIKVYEVKIFWYII